MLAGKLAAVSVGVHSVWGIDDTNRVWCRTGISDAKPEGGDWVSVPSLMRDITVGPTGIVWGVSLEENKLWMRTNTTPKNPIGDTWQAVDGNMSQVSAGACQLY